MEELSTLIQDMKEQLIIKSAAYEALTIEDEEVARQMEVVRAKVNQLVNWSNTILTTIASK